MSALELTVALVILVAGGAVPIWLVLTATGLTMARRPSGVLETMQSLHEIAGAYARWVLLPALTILVGAATWAAAAAPALARLVFAGAVAGVISTLALDPIRLTGYAKGWMPSNMPHAFGRMILGPMAMAGAVKTIGFAYHVLNGIGLGLLYALLFGNASWWWGIVFATGVAIAMGISPPILMTGSGVMMLRRGMAPMIVMIVAHLAMGVVLGAITQWVAGGPGLLALLIHWRLGGA